MAPREVGPDFAVRAHFRSVHQARAPGNAPQLCIAVDTLDETISVGGEATRKQTALIVSLSTTGTDHADDHPQCHLPRVPQGVLVGREGSRRLIIDSAMSLWLCAPTKNNHGEGCE